ncbi:hypothetical protein [Streptomyces sp. NBC_01180]|uniref:hypothetical protein n=1 Tax=Streptomyces sp. NBC_01180 TaxID=2903763 RepID=UPI00386D4C6F|nr:hypothetical protein OG708_08925 [Streptomyces sp. NBC_01180]
MIKHKEVLRSIGEAQLVPGESYSDVTLDVVTAGGVAKTLRFSESNAAAILRGLLDALEARPAEGAAERFKASQGASR